jgi:hypothetical protein
MHLNHPLLPKILANYKAKVFGGGRLKMPRLQNQQHSQYVEQKGTRVAQLQQRRLLKGRKLKPLPLPERDFPQVDAEY